MTTITIARVAKGVALLDDKLPGWRARIDLDTLDIGSASHCIVGQLFGADEGEWPGVSYNRGLNALGILGEDIAYGFEVDMDDLDEDDDEDWKDAWARQRDDMQDAWEHAIAG